MSNVSVTRVMTRSITTRLHFACKSMKRRSGRRKTTGNQFVSTVLMSHVIN